MKSDVRRGYLTPPSDPTLRQKETGLRKAVNSLQHVARSTMSDPEVLPLVDPAATVLKVGWREMPVNSDEEALRSYLAPSVPTGSDSVGLLFRSKLSLKSNELIPICGMFNMFTN